MIFRRKSRVNVGKYRPPAPRPTPSVESQVDEAVLILSSWIRMTVANDAIVWILRDTANFEPLRYVDAVRELLHELSSEKREDAARVLKERKRTPSAKALGAPDTGESARLRLRHDILVGLAARLERLSSDEDFVEKLALSSRDAARSQVQEAIHSAALRRIHVPNAVEGTEREQALRDFGAYLRLIDDPL